MAPFNNQFPHFKPQFGNTDHIDILEAMGRYYKDRERYEQVLKDRKKNIGLYKKCVEQKKRIRQMIDYANKKTA